MTRPTESVSRRTHFAVTVVAALLGVGGVAVVAVGAARQVEQPVPPEPPAAGAPAAPTTSASALATKPITTNRTATAPARPGNAQPATAPRRGTAAAPLPPGTIEQDASAWMRVEPLRRSTPVRVRIPAIGVDAGTVRLGLRRDGEMEVPSGASPVGWYDRSPTPGQNGPSVLAAHVTWNGEEGAFFDLARLRPGDQVAVQRADRTTARFVVRKVEQYAKSSFPRREVYGQTPAPTLRLITCAGTFDRDSRTYADNVVVYADALPPSR